MGHGGRHFRGKVYSLYLAAQGSEPLRGRGFRPPAGGASPRWLNTWAGAFAPPRPFGWPVDNPAGCPPANLRLPRLRRSDLGRFPHGLTDSFSPIACRLSRLVSSSGGAAPRVPKARQGAGAQPLGAGGRRPRRSGGNRPLWGTDMSYPQLTGGRYPFTGERYPVTETAHS